MDRNPYNYKALLKDGRLAKTVDIDDLIPFGKKSARSINGYVPTLIEYSSLVDQLVKDVHLKADVYPSLETVLGVGNTTGAADISINTGQSVIWNNGGFTGSISEGTFTANRVFTLPDNSGTLALLSDVQASDQLSEILANGNVTGANDIVMTAGQKITSTSGGGVLMLDDGANYVNLGNSSGTYGDSGVYLEPDAAHMYSGGYSSLVSCKLRLGVHTVQMTAPTAATIQTISGYTGEDGSSGVYGLSFAKTNSGTVASTSGGLSTFGAILIAKDSSIAMGTANTAVVSGDTIVATASNALYANELRLQKAANSFDGIFDIGTLTAARTYTFQDASGTVAFTSDITNGIYDGSGTIPTTTTATITDTLNMNNGTARVRWATGGLELSTDNGTLNEGWIDMATNYNAFGMAGLSIIEGRPDNVTALTGSIIVGTKLNTTNNAVKTGGATAAATFINSNGGTINSGVSNSIIIGGDGTHTATSTVSGSTHIQGFVTIYDDLTMNDAANVILNTTTGTKIGTGATQKLGFWNATPVVQPSHIADPAAVAALTQDSLTDNSGGTADTTIAAITNAANAGSADVGPVADAIADIAAQLAKIKTDIAAVKTGTDANNTAIDAILADLATLGLQAAV